MLEKLTFVLCPTTFPEYKFEKYHNENFNFWWNSWEAVFREKDVGLRLTSDLFTRQHFTGSLFEGDKCVGQICYRVADAQHAPTRFDSYFRNWSENNMTSLTAQGSRILISSYLSVAKDYRGHEAFGVAIKDLLIGFYGFIQRECGAAGIAAAPRKDRNVNRTCADWGGVTVEEGVPSGYGDFVDLVVFQNDCLEQAKIHPHYLVISKLWRDRLVIAQDFTPDQSFNLNISPLSA